MSNAAGSLVLDGADQKEGQEHNNQIDFKMVTFSLSGKDYGIDIMKIKEIAKFSSFTYVPNSAPYVRGVYNLRGDIISILDLRILFHLPVDKKAENEETQNGLILSLDENVIGVVVDSIDKVIGFSSAGIQPPHPIFGDINIKYISGVVENEGRLYIILNAERICAKDDSVRKAADSALPAAADTAAAAVSAETYQEPQSYGNSLAAEPERDFIRETLKTFKGFSITPVNEEWFTGRFAEWKEKKKQQGADLQLKSADDADEYLASYYSADTGRFWEDDTAARYTRALAAQSGKIIQAWSIGSGKGFEAYSFAAILARKYPGVMLKVWAHDNDLLAISTAPNLVFNDDELPEFLGPYIVMGKNGSSFQTEFKNKIFFEYHDALHPNSLPELDFIMARDVLPFFSQEDQARLFAEFHEKLKPTGLLFLGDNEKPLDSSRWAPVSGARAVYKKS
ncbi:MAG: chemotaxis protein CheW [Spirochaetales bacterium]|jgi:purine-binding chemotaxis protein CheW|nr:chemotaxis protein CheW [Spirochaetales bacterium]